MLVCVEFGMERKQRIRWSLETARSKLPPVQSSRVQTSKKRRRHHSAEVIQSTSPAKKAMLPPRLLMKLHRQQCGPEEAILIKSGGMMAGWGAHSTVKHVSPCKAHGGRIVVLWHEMNM